MEERIGYHPLGAWVANTRECPDMLLRPGNAGSNTFTDHKEVLDRALKQVPAPSRRKVIVRFDGAGASHDLIEHLLTLSSPRKTLLFTCGWMITAADEAAIMDEADHAGPGIRLAARPLPGRQYRGGQGRRGDHLPHDQGRELAGRATVDRPPGQAVPQAPEEPHRLREETGWKYSITCTNIPDAGVPGVPGSHHPQYIDVLHRDHATVETAKAMGLRTLPSKTWQVNKGWVLAANIAADLTAWARLLGFSDQPGLRDAEPDTLRYRIWQVPGRLVRHARKRILKISPDWPWKDAFLTCWQRLCDMPAPP